ncbi:MAG: HAD family hydrolase [Bacilli bacterium]|nr:HAD family hydrolase [Bacilli bacterium]
MKRYKLYLFDFDGTLFDTSKALNMVFKVSFAKVGTTVTDDQITWLSRVPLFEAYEELGCPSDAASVKLFIDTINASVDSKESINLTELFHDTAEFLKYAKENDVHIGIVTSNNSNHVKDILNHFNIPTDSFDVIVGNVEAPTPKPDPLPINVALKMANYQGDLKDVIYVGDSHNDCLAAINAGVDHLLLDRHSNSTENFKKIKSLLDLFA